MWQSLRNRSYRVFALCWIVASAGFCVYAADLPEPADADLSFTSRRLPAERNAVTELNEAAQNLKYPDDYAGSGDRIDLAIVGAEWDPDWVAKLLASNSIALAKFEQALGKDALQLRVLSNYGEEQALGNWLMLAKLSALEIRASALRGESEQALDGALVLAHFGSRLREIDGGRMIHYLTGTSVIRVALFALQRMLAETSVSPGSARRLVGSLEGLRLRREGWARVARGDYQWTKAVLDESVAARGITGVRVSRDPFARQVLESLHSLAPRWYSLQRNRTLSRLAGHYRDSMNPTASHVSRACSGTRCPGRDLTSVGVAPNLYSIERNALGNYWADLAGRTIRIYQQTGRVSESMVSAVQVMVALRAFEGSRGQLPDTLAELVPDYLARVPLDYFDGHEIRYSSAEHLIYSVGSDLADAKGRWHEGDPCNSELSFPIPFAVKGHSEVSSIGFICGASQL